MASNDANAGDTAPSLEKFASSAPSRRLIATSTEITTTARGMDSAASAGSRSSDAYTAAKCRASTRGKNSTANAELPAEARGLPRCG
ncbi:hypothetical protein PUN28_017243 [Cardiocondyla obscurior]|uniref:Uncharacterized protein n=1 Tax=Cardiocondyla obscurior TaxID=286306 RepID=A0AAW2ERD6_9HYME